MTDPTSIDTTSSPPPQAPRWKPLDARQRRVLGVLIEKAKTTPAGYPMTVNAVVVGCNQKSNREPPMSLEAFDVEKALDELRNLGAVSEVDWLGRAARWRHHAYEWFGVSKPEIAVLTELLLRGEQTLGDLRARAARMEPIADLAALRPIVDGLLQRGLMVELTPPGRGQMVTHNVYTAPELAELKTRLGGQGRQTVFRDEPESEAPRYSAPAAPHGEAAAYERLGAAASADAGAVDRLATTVDELRAEVTRLRERVEDLERRLDSRG